MFRELLEGRLGQKAHLRRSRAATDIGSQAHKLIEWMLRKELNLLVGPRPQVSEKAEWAFMAFEDWCRSVNLKPLKVERTVWSDPLNNLDSFAGTIDLIAQVPVLPAKDGPRPNEPRRNKSSSSSWPWKSKAGSSSARPPARAFWRGSGPGPPFPGPWRKTGLPKVRLYQSAL